MINIQENKYYIDESNNILLSFVNIKEHYLTIYYPKINQFTTFDSEWCYIHIIPNLKEFKITPLFKLLYGLSK